MKEIINHTHHLHSRSSSGQKQGGIVVASAFWPYASSTTPLPATPLECSSPPVAQPHLSASLFGEMRLGFVGSDSLFIHKIKKEFLPAKRGEIPFWVVGGIDENCQTK